ncbi:MAG TPA: phosphoesterase, partial [Gammaproteobacteria bacterium]|nr:phosphoesterase [Gammaproteobacteria bacterium]
MVDEIRGIEAKHESAAQQIARDTRPLGTRFAEFLTLPATNFVFTFTGIALCFVMPAVADIILVVLFSLFLFSYTRKSTLPFRLPESSEAMDYNDLVPGTSKPRMARGISFFGNDRTTQEELWFSNEDMRTHVLIFGSTGSGKTEALVSIACNSLIQASGFIYIDGKGDNSLFAKIFSMVRTIGRDDDMLLVNFMTGARDVIGAQTS